MCADQTMRSLIRFFLFTVARLGLFLAVVAWIIGQWRTIEGTGFNVVVGVCEPGVVIWVIHESHEWTVEETGARSKFDCMFDQGEETDERVLQLRFGPVAYWGLPGWRTVSVKHWLMVSIFALLYCVVKWVYRNRKIAGSSPISHAHWTHEKETNKVPLRQQADSRHGQISRPLPQVRSEGRVNNGVMGQNELKSQSPWKLTGRWTHRGRPWFSTSTPRSLDD